MARNLDSLGYARVYRHPRTGDLVVDTDTLRRGGFGEFGEDPETGEDDDFDGDDELGDDELGDEDVGDDFGAQGRRRRKRLNRRIDRLEHRRSQVGSGRSRRAPPAHDRNQVWGMTAVGGTDSLTAAGAATVKVRLQHDFRAQDITFTGSASGAKVTSIFFGDRVVWSNSDGIDASVFASTGFLRGLLKGQSIRAGLDVIVSGNLPAAGDFAVTLIGQKPVAPNF